MIGVVVLADNQKRFWPSPHSKLRLKDLVPFHLKWNTANPTDISTSVCQNRCEMGCCKSPQV